jgi:hypothetical protein
MGTRLGEWECLFHHGEYEWRPSFLYWLLIGLSVLFVPALIGVAGLIALGIGAKLDYDRWYETDRVEEWLEVVPEQHRRAGEYPAPPPPPGPPWQVRLR